MLSSILQTDAMASLGSHWWALVDVIGCNLHNRCDSRTFDRTKLNMFNPCDPGRNSCRVYGCTCSCSCMFVYTVRSPRRSRVCLHGAIVAAIASCKHRISCVHLLHCQLVCLTIVVGVLVFIFSLLQSFLLLLVSELC